MRILAAIALTLVALPAFAQDTEPTAADRRRAAMEAREQAELRVEQGMITMTGIVEAMAHNLGQMHYLRTLCFGPSDQRWREYMGRLLDIEAGSDYDTRSELTVAFNAGYYAEEKRHSTCSRAVSADVAALAENGRSLATMLGDPYREPN